MPFIHHIHHTGHPTNPPSFKSLQTISLPIIHRRSNTMVTRAKPPQLHPLPAHNLLAVAVAPLDGHFGVGVGVHQHVESAGASVELREEGDGGGDLAEDGGDFGLDLCFCFVRRCWCRGGVCAAGVFLIFGGEFGGGGRRGFRFGLGFGRGVDLNLESEYG